MTVLPVWAVSRLRMATDGVGVTTLVAAKGCPLRCKYCLNPISRNGNVKPVTMSPPELYERVRIDDLYFQATGGGVTFGGGEPLAYPEFIREFRSICPAEWKLRAETSLNVPQENVKTVLRAVDEFIVDIKDMNPEIYRTYTGASNERVYGNLSYLIGALGPCRILVRVPRIPGFNTDADVQSSLDILRDLGAERFDVFEYRSGK